MKDGNIVRVLSMDQYEAFESSIKVVKWMMKKFTQGKNLNWIANRLIVDSWTVELFQPQLDEMNEKFNRLMSHMDNICQQVAEEPHKLPRNMRDRVYNSHDKFYKMMMVKGNIFSLLYAEKRVLGEDNKHVVIWKGKKSDAGILNQLFEFVNEVGVLYFQIICEAVSRLNGRIPGIGESKTNVWWRFIREVDEQLHNLMEKVLPVVLWCEKYDAPIFPISNFDNQQDDNGSYVI